MGLNHLDDRGRARMVDVTGKPETERSATASGTVRLKPETLGKIRGGSLPKGDVYTVARVAGILAAKQVPSLIPMAHPLPLSGVEVGFEEDSRTDPDGMCRITITAAVRTVGRTGVEMEALAAVCGAALTIYDMCKSADRGMIIGEVMLRSKSGGRSGDFRRSGAGKG
jgi:cyclic pyranopterin phosphate synthase